MDRAPVIFGRTGLQSWLSLGEDPWNPNGRTNLNTDWSATRTPDGSNRESGLTNVWGDSWGSLREGAQNTSWSSAPGSTSESLDFYLPDLAGSAPFGPFENRSTPLRISALGQGLDDPLPLPADASQPPLRERFDTISGNSRLHSEQHMSDLRTRAWNALEDVLRKPERVAEPSRPNMPYQPGTMTPLDMESVLAELPSGRKKRGLPPLPELFPIPSPEELHNMIANFAGRSTGSRQAELPPWAGASFVPNLPSQSNVATLPSQPPSFLGQFGRQPESQAKHPSGQSTGTASFTPLDAQSAEAFGPRWQNPGGVSATAFDPLTGSTLLAAAKHTATDAGGQAAKPVTEKPNVPERRTIKQPEEIFKPIPQNAINTIYDRIRDKIPFFEKTRQQIYEETGVSIPLELVFTFMIIESTGENLSPKQGSTSSGYMQVNDGARKEVEKSKLFNKTFASNLKKNIGDDSPYYGSLYMNHLAKLRNIDIENLNMLDTAINLYYSYLMGSSGSKRFFMLNPDQSIDTALQKSSLNGNPKFFLDNGISSGKPLSKKEVKRRIERRVIVAYNAMEKIMQLHAENQQKGPYETGI